jgi:predicted nuclease of predicted toxin-antitoxin system
MNTPGLLTDEHVPGPCIAVLRSIGHEIVLARDACVEGASDARLLEFARENGYVVLT